MNEASEIQWNRLESDALPVGVIRYPYKDSRLFVARTRSLDTNEIWIVAYWDPERCATFPTHLHCLPSRDYVDLEIAVVKHCKYCHFYQMRK